MVVAGVTTHGIYCQTFINYEFRITHVCTLSCSQGLSNQCMPQPRVECRVCKIEIPVFGAASTNECSRMVRYLCNTLHCPHSKNYMLSLLNACSITDILAANNVSPVPAY